MTSGLATLSGLLVVAALLQLSAVIGLSYAAGFRAVWRLVEHARWLWIAIAVIPVVVAGGAYHLAYRSLFRLERRIILAEGQLAALAAAAYSGMLSVTAALDLEAARAGGAESRSSVVRVVSLSGLEQGVLGLIGCVASCWVLIADLPRPTPDFTLPWAIAPVPGLIIAFWVTSTFRHRLRRRDGWRNRLAIFLDAVALLERPFRQPWRYAAVSAMAVFWVGEMATVWLALKAFGDGMALAPLVVGYATGMLFTRRTIPLAGAGVLMVILPVTIWYSGASFASAILAVFAYRVLTVWLPLPAALAGLPSLRSLLTRPMTASSA